jgi:DNA (cytosine-5)-methyltransferase 1
LSLRSLGYEVEEFILSPNEISNIPALRERFYITAYKTRKLKYSNSHLIEKKVYKKYRTSIYENHFNKWKLDEKYFENGLPADIDEHKIEVINMWNDLVKSIKKSKSRLISPLWPNYFDEKINIIDMPMWKQGIVNRNRKWYKENKQIFDKWYKKHQLFFESLTDSQKKFEWNAGEEIDDVWEGIIQFRPSGVRVKKPDFIPTLVAINQTPIIGIEKRYIKPQEISKLYGFSNLDFGNQPLSQTLKQLGNTVSVDVVAYLIKLMIEKSGVRGLLHE